jgi:hypothetical protein
MESLNASSVVARIESWIKTTSQMANKLFLKKKKFQFSHSLTTSEECFSHELISQLCSAFTRYHILLQTTLALEPNNHSTMV